MKSRFNIKAVFCSVIMGGAFLIWTAPEAQGQTSMCCCGALAATQCIPNDNFVTLENFIGACESGFFGRAVPETYDDTGLTCQGNSSDDCAAICLATLPVELVSFDAVTDRGSVILKWETASEADNAGFHIEHEAPTDDTFAAIAFVEGRGTTNESVTYGFTVSDLDPGVHRFRLKQVDFDGAFEYSPVVEAAIELPNQFVIEPAYPNPFNPSTTIRFASAVEQEVEVTMVNAAGMVVRELYRGTVAANAIHLINVDGDGLSSGTYLIRFNGESGTVSQQVTLSK